MDNEIRIGDMVETSIFVGQKRISMGRGRVIKVHSGYCDVDHCYPYGKSCVYAETTNSLRKIKLNDNKKIQETSS